MINFHPSDNDLIEYASGSCSWALSICISAHLHYCPHCRSKLASLNHIGGSIFESETTPQQVSSSASDALKMAKQQATSEHSHVTFQNISADKPNTPYSLPVVINKLLKTNNNARWKRLSPSLKAMRLVTGQKKYEVCLHKIRRGGKVIAHGHQGREFTLVLDGSFSDENGTYLPGDFVSMQPGQSHRPTASQDRDCLCLSVSEAPVTISGVFGKLLTPFTRVYPQ